MLELRSAVANLRDQEALHHQQTSVKLEQQCVADKIMVTKDNRTFTAEVIGKLLFKKLTGELLLVPWMFLIDDALTAFLKKE